MTKQVWGRCTDTNQCGWLTPVSDQPDTFITGLTFVNGVLTVERSDGASFPVSITIPDAETEQTNINANVDPVIDIAAQTITYATIDDVTGAAGEFVVDLSALFTALTSAPFPALIAGDNITITGNATDGYTFNSTDPTVDTDTFGTVVTNVDGSNTFTFPDGSTFTTRNYLVNGANADNAATLNEFHVLLQRQNVGDFDETCPVNERVPVEMANNGNMYAGLKDFVGCEYVQFGPTQVISRADLVALPDTDANGLTPAAGFRGVELNRRTVATLVNPSQCKPMIVVTDMITRGHAHEDQINRDSTTFVAATFLKVNMVVNGANHHTMEIHKMQSGVNDRYTHCNGFQTPDCFTIAPGDTAVVEFWESYLNRNNAADDVPYEITFNPSGARFFMHLDNS